MKLHTTTLLLSALAAASAQAAVVSTIDAGGDNNITEDLGSFTSADMQSLITSTNDLTIAGVLDAEGTFSAGDFSKDTGALSDKITGTTRYGRDGGTADKASGDRWGFVNATSGSPEVWTPDAGLTHFGLISTNNHNNNGGPNGISVTVTYSDATTETEAATQGQTSWLGFHKAGQTITSISLYDTVTVNSAFANYDDVSLVFVPEPGSLALLGLGSLLVASRRRRG